MAENQITLMNHKNYIPIGAPAAGKGYIQKRLRGELGNSMFTISTGAMVRARLDFDQEFARKYREAVASGDLVPDSEIVAMAENEYRRGIVSGVSLVYWDGVFRTGNQLDLFLRKGILKPEDTTCILLLASESVCAQNNRHRIANLTDGVRVDMNAKFEHRFQVFNEHKDALIKKINKVGIKLIQIDANRALVNVATDVIAHVRSFLAPSSTMVAESDGQSARARIQCAGFQPWVDRPGSNAARALA